MLNATILHTLFKLNWFLINWNIFLKSFLTLILYCLNLLILFLRFILNLLINQFYCFLILLIFYWRLIHNTFICNRPNLLYTFIFHTDFHVSYADVSYTWLNIWYTYINEGWLNIRDTYIFYACFHIRYACVFHAWWFGLHTFSILHTLIFFKKYCSLNWTINRWDGVESLNRLINHFYIRLLNWNIMYLWFFLLIFHLNAFFFDTWTMINCILYSFIWWLTKWNSYTFIYWLSERYANSSIWVLPKWDTNTFIWFIKYSCKFWMLLLLWKNSCIKI